MFASAATTMHQRQAGAYKQVHLSTGVSDASPHELVALLYEGFFDALARARGAMRSGNVEAKGRAIGMAVGIVTEGLRGALNLKDGGKLASNLNDLYSYIAFRLLQANLHSDEVMLDECAALVEPIRQAWTQIAVQNPGA
jgi:flagellar protein FliS